MCTNCEDLTINKTLMTAVIVLKHLQNTNIFHLDQE